MNILILAGGLSPEREVSLSSASKIAKSLIKQGNKVCIADICCNIKDVKQICFTNKSDEIKTYAVNGTAPKAIEICEKENEIGENVMEACKTADFVFIALHGGIGENGKLQAVFDLNGIKYTGSGYDGCMLAMDKNISKMIACAHQIKTAKWSMNTKAASLSFPCVVKPANCGSSIGVAMVNNGDELASAIRLAEPYDNAVLIEEKIEGREFSVGILDDKPLPVIEIKPKSGFYDYKNKYQADLTQEICPADISANLSDRLQQTALKMHRLLHLFCYSRIDFMVDKKEDIYFIEANALPGMTPASLLPQEAAAAGISYECLCEKIAESAFGHKRIYKS